MTSELREDALDMLVLVKEAGGQIANGVLATPAIVWNPVAAIEHSLKHTAPEGRISQLQTTDTPLETLAVGGTVGVGVTVGERLVDATASMLSHLGPAEYLMAPLQFAYDHPLETAGGVLGVWALHGLRRAGQYVRRDRVPEVEYVPGQQ